MSTRDHSQADWTVLAPWFSIPVLRAKPARPTKSAAEREEDRLDRNALARARRVAAPLGVDIERDSAGGYWVTHPDLDDKPEDPCEDAHFCGDGREVEQAVKTYADFFANLKG